MQEECMKSNKLTCLMLLALFTTGTIPELLAAQEQQEHNKKLPRYRVIDLGTLGGTFSDALGVSNRGWVAGWSFLPGDANLHALLWRKGLKTDLGTLGGPNSSTFTNSSVNERGEVVGAAESSALDPLGENFFLCFNDGLLCLPFMWQDGVMRSLPTLGGNNGVTFAINNSGGVVGTTENTTPHTTCVAPKSSNSSLSSGKRTEFRSSQPFLAIRMGSLSPSTGVRRLESRLIVH
jgi:probable HAF family extracellular repeat protein